MFSVNSLLCNANGPHTATAVFLDSLIKGNYKGKFLVVFSSELRNLFQWAKLSPLALIKHASEISSVYKFSFSLFLLLQFHVLVL